jgi:hypothetical protein
VGKGVISGKLEKKLLCAVSRQADWRTARKGGREGERVCVVVGGGLGREREGERERGSTCNLSVPELTGDALDADG